MENSAGLLATLLLCGLMGMLGQGVRAAVGLKSAAALDATTPGQQSEFNAAYFLISLMIGFIAGVLAGIGVGIKTVMAVTSSDINVLLGIAVAGYAGADFIENAFTRIIPGLGAPQAGRPGGKAAPPFEAAGAQVPTPPTLPPVADIVPPTVIPTLAAALNLAAPAVSTAVWGPTLSAAFIKFEMTSNRRIAAAIGQFLVEAGAGFQELVENLNYTHAERLVEVFPNEFPTVADAEPYLGKPEALANRVYANRNGNGTAASGDGYLFRGRGLIQLTGRTEYTEFAATVGMIPEQAATYCETPAGAAMSGCWYLSSRGCLLLADVWALSKITLKVNGEAMVGNTQRIAYSNTMLKGLGG
jgi:predicted chitinase